MSTEANTPKDELVIPAGAKPIDRLRGVTAVLPLIWLAAMPVALSIGLPAAATVILLIGLLALSVFLLAAAMKDDAPEEVIVVGNEIHHRDLDTDHRTHIANIDRLSRLTIRPKLPPKFTGAQRYLPSVKGIIGYTDCSIVAELIDGSERVLVQHLNKPDQGRQIAEIFHERLGIPSWFDDLNAPPPIDLGSQRDDHGADNPVAELRSALAADQPADLHEDRSKTWDFPVIDPNT